MGIVYKRIFNGGIQERPFKAHKRYEVTDVNYSSSFEISILRGISTYGVLTEVSTSIDNAIGVDPSIKTGSGAMTSELNSIPQQIVWDSINSYFFKRTPRVLYDTASIISIPQNKFGDGIKPGSFYATCSSAETSASYMYDIKVDSDYGIIVDPDVSTTTMPRSSDTILKLSFDDKKINSSWKNTTDDSTYDNIVKTLNITIGDGPTTTGGLSASVGKSAQSNVSSSLIVRNNSLFDSINNYDDWAVSMRVKLPLSQSWTDEEANPLISKRWNNLDAVRNSQVYSNKTHYPLDLSLLNDSVSGQNGKVKFGISDGRRYGKTEAGTFITSSTLINDNTWHSLIVNKTGSNYELYVDGVLDSTLDASNIKTTNNEQDITIFSSRLSTRTDYTSTSGSFDEVRIYRRSLTSDNIESLTNNHWYSGSFTQTNQIGHIFYNTGIVVISDPRPKYKNMFLGDGNWDYTNRPFEFNYKATKVVEEVSLLCEINRDEFNVSSNPSLRVTSNEKEERLKPMVTGSDFRPYITQIGLYNDDLELLAVAKLGSPLKKRQDVDVTINVKFDID
jgi:hypothetical protein